MPNETTPSVAEQADERAAFEADYLRTFGKPGYLGLSVAGEYEHAITHARFEGWKAHASLAASQAASHSAPDPVAAIELRQIVQHRDERARRVYIAGPMTGLPEYNFPAFNAKAAELRVEGWHVENPAEHGHVEGAGWADYLRWDISRIATCGAIYLLPGWEASKGASLEVHIGRTLGIEFMGAPAAAVPAALTPDEIHERAPKGYSWTECGAWGVGYNTAVSEHAAAVPESPAACDFTATHRMALQPKSGIEVCTACGRGPISAKKHPCPQGDDHATR